MKKTNKKNAKQFSNNELVEIRDFLWAYMDKLSNGTRHIETTNKIGTMSNRITTELANAGG